MALTNDLGGRGQRVDIDRQGIRTQIEIHAAAWFPLAAPSFTNTTRTPLYCVPGGAEIAIALFWFPGGVKAIAADAPSRRCYPRQSFR